VALSPAGGRLGPGNGVTMGSTAWTAAAARGRWKARARRDY